MLIDPPDFPPPWFQKSKDIFEAEVALESKVFGLLKFLWNFWLIFQFINKFTKRRMRSCLGVFERVYLYIFGQYVRFYRLLYALHY